MDIFLHEKQAILDGDDHRFQVVAAGRRFGKSFFAAYKLYEAASQKTKVRSDGTEIDLTNEVVYYVSPTFKQGRENLWNVMMDMGNQAGCIEGVRANEGEIRLTNGRIIRFKGADDPDSLRGVGLHYVVMDEYAFMKPFVWEYIIRPALGRAEGGALFIGTPDGKNHFYEMWLSAKRGLDPSSGKESSSWKAFQFKTEDNPHLTGIEIEEMQGALSADAIKQELEASFEATGGKVFTMDMFPVVPWPGGNAATVIAADLAGFSKADGRKGVVSILDDHAIAIALIHDKGWHIQQILHGKWDVRGTALKIIKAWRQNGKPEVGIERGMAKNAVCGDDGASGYLGELMQKWGYFTVKPLTHGNQKKEDRIKWSIQGRAEKGQITLEPDDHLPPEDKWVGKFLSQAVDFPNSLAKDDLLDAVSYVDQMADTACNWNALSLYDDWQPHDREVGF
jgi:hypothetical protein